MKKRIMSSVLLFAAVGGLAAFTSAPQSSVTGKITPADGAVSVWALSATDSVKTSSIVAGTFTLQARPGKYKVVIDGKEPFKDVTLDNIELRQDQVMDVGEIVLQQ